jgi:hypothetical protein
VAGFARKIPGLTDFGCSGSLQTPEKGEAFSSWFNKVLRRLEHQAFVFRY